MTFLAFSVDDRRFALPAADVVTIVPAAALRAIDAAPAWVAGLLPVGADLVPVIDLCRLHAGRAARHAFTTRIILLRYLRPDGASRVLGLLAEGVADVAEVEPGQWHDAGLARPDTPWLGPLAMVGGALIQRIAIADLLPQAVRDRLFP
jgi:chemotaxis-related protein WspB